MNFFRKLKLAEILFVTMIVFIVAGCVFIIIYPLLSFIFWGIGIVVFVYLSIFLKTLKKKRIALREQEFARMKEKPLDDFLKNNGLEQYCEIFKNNKLEKVSDAIELTDSDLQNIGIIILGDRKKLLLLLGNIKTMQSNIEETTSMQNALLKCPSCDSNDLQAITEMEGKTKGFGCCSGALGAIVFGPIGWLCGLCGMGKGKTKSKTLWLCKNCGKKFA